MDEFDLTADDTEEDPLRPLNIDDASLSVPDCHFFIPVSNGISRYPSTGTGGNKGVHAESGDEMNPKIREAGDGIIERLQKKKKKKTYFGTTLVVMKMPSHLSQQSCHCEADSACSWLIEGYIV